MTNRFAGKRTLRQPEPACKRTDLAGGIWGLVDVDMSKLSGKTVRVNITMPSRVLAIIDAAAAREGESRSGLLTRTVLEHIDRKTGA